MEVYVKVIVIMTTCTTYQYILVHVSVIYLDGSTLCKKYDCHAVGGDLRHMMWRKILPFLIMEIVWKTNGCQVIRNR